MSSKRLDIKASDGGSFSAYLSLPESGRGSGLVLIQEIFGVNDHIRSVADGFAKEGYVVLAPDMFWRIQPNVEFGYTGEDLQKAFEIYPKFKLDQGVRDIGDTIKALLQLPECTDGVSMVGYCLGGTLTYLSAAALPQVKAAIAYYGGGISDHLDQASKITCPLLMNFGELDKHIPITNVEKIRQAFKDKNNVEICVYPEADHGFNCSQRASYNKSAADLAYSRTLSTLSAALGRK